MAQHKIPNDGVRRRIAEMRRRRRATTFFALGAALLLAGCQTLDNARLLLPPDWADMRRVTERVVVERDAGPADAERAVAVATAARERLERVLGEVRADPMFFVCASDACFQRFGGGAPRAKAFSDRRILLGPRGDSAGFAAHEMWHAELFRRLGLVRVMSLPRWFDEGVAVWISNEPVHSEAMYQRALASGIRMPTLGELESRDGFYAAIARTGDDKRAGRTADDLSVVYPVMGHEIRRWIAVVGVDGLRALLSALEAGDDFQTTYERLETGTRTGSHRESAPK